MLYRPLIALLCLFVSAGSVLAIEKSVRPQDEAELLDAAKAGDEGTSDEEEAPEPAAKLKRAAKRAAAPAGERAGEDVAIDAEPSTMRQAEELVESAGEAPEATEPADEAEALAAAAKAKAAKVKKDKAARQAAARRAAAVFDEPGAADAGAKAEAPLKRKAKKAPPVDAEEPAAEPDVASTEETSEEAPVAPKKAKKVKTTKKPVDAATLGSHGDDSVGAIALPAKKNEKASKPEAVEKAERVEKAEPVEKTEPVEKAKADKPEVAEPALAPKDDPASVRGRAFKAPISFTSKGQIKAFMIKINRDLHYTFKPVIEGGVVTALNLKMVDRGNDDKVTEGVVQITADGKLTAEEKTLTNACNLALIDPATHAKLRTEEGPFETRGTMEVQGNILQLTIKHRRIGAANADGSMTVESTSDSDCDRVHTKTVTELAADGLPMSAETTGTIAKGPINLNVNLKLQRESGIASVE